MTRAETFWENSQELISKNMTTLSYDNWMRPLVPAKLEGDNLILIAPDETTVVTLRQFYSSTVSDLVSTANSEHINVEFMTRNEFDSKHKLSARENGAGAENSDLIGRYTFDTFVVGNSNQFAYAAAIAVADRPGTTYNPLFIYGGVGLGKTHLMHAIGNAIIAKNPAAKVKYVTSEMFTIEFIGLVNEGHSREFRSRYRNVDVLMVDDIQFLVGKWGTQEEFYNTFNTLCNAGKQIIITSDKPPRELPDIEARLNSRFEGGLVADIQPPDFETRVGILLNKANSEGVKVSNDVLYHIAKRVRSNVRTLEGAFTRVVAQSVFNKCPITVEFADEAIKDLASEDERSKLSPKYIIDAVADYYSVSCEEICGARRDKRITFPRQVGMYLCRRLIDDASLSTIGEAFSRDHTTVLHACNRISELIATEPDVAIEINDIVVRIQRG